jgi:hypothetical protein
MSLYAHVVREGGEPRAQPIQVQVRQLVVSQFEFLSAVRRASRD